MCCLAVLKIGLVFGCKRSDMDTIEEYTEDKLELGGIIKQIDVDDPKSSQRITKRNKETIVVLERQLRTIEARIADKEKSIELMLSANSNPPTVASHPHSIRIEDTTASNDFISTNDTGLQRLGESIVRN